MLIYSALRLVLFVAALLVGYLVGLGGWLLPLVALVVAFAVSYLALRTQRDAAAAWLAERDQRRKERKQGMDRLIDEDADAEDAAVDGRTEPADGTAGDGPGRRS